MLNPELEKVGVSADLIIKLNQNPVPSDCPLCNSQTNPNIGAELFLAGTDSIVCLDCASEHAPILACLITFADFARWCDGNPFYIAELSRLLVSEEKRFGERWENEQGFSRNQMNAYQDFGFETRGENVHETIN